MNNKRRTESMQPLRVRMRSSISRANNQGDGSSPASAPPCMAWHLHRQFIHACHPRLQRRLPNRLVQRIRLNHRSDRMILLKVHCLVRLALTGGYILSLPENSEL